MVRVPLPSTLADVDGVTIEAYRLALANDTGVFILRDLAMHVGYLAALPPGADAVTLADHNARRAVFGRVLEILALTDAGRETLARALLPAPAQQE
jgi:hypothetical protein